MILKCVKSRFLWPKVTKGVCCRKLKFLLPSVLFSSEFALSVAFTACMADLNSVPVEEVRQSLKLPSVYSARGFLLKISSIEKLPGFPAIGQKKSFWNMVNRVANTASVSDLLCFE